MFIVNNFIISYIIKQEKKMFNLWKKKNEYAESLNDIREDLHLIRLSIKELSKETSGLNSAMIRLWHAEDIEENNGEFRWPFDKNGNLLNEVKESI